MLGNFRGSYAAVRTEWAKGWAYGPGGAWTNPEVLGGHIPACFSDGQPQGDDWTAALAALDRYDPARVFSNPFLDRLMPPPIPAG